MLSGSLVAGDAVVEVVEVVVVVVVPVGVVVPWVSSQCARNMSILFPSDTDGGGGGTSEVSVGDDISDD